MKRPGLARVLVLAATCACWTGCGEPEGGFALRAPDYAVFESQVMPILSRDCAYHACHGARQRFFQVLGPGRPRLSPATMDADPITVEELRFNYDRARSMIDREDPARSPLFLKPLAVQAGGYGHEGTDLFGRDVYSSDLDPSFVVLQNWALSAPLEGEAAAPQAVVPGAGQPAANGPATMQPGGP